MTLVNFEELKNKYQNKLAKDTEVTCKILAKLKDGFLVDINEEWEGFIPLKEINNNGTELLLFETVQGLITSGPDKSERYTISPKALHEKHVYENLQKTVQENGSIKVAIAKVIKGGAEAFIDGVRAFLPGRYIRLPGISPEKWVGQEIEVLIEEIDYKEKKIILNHKKAVDIEKQKKAEFTIQKLKEGDIVNAPVLRVADFGVFVDLGGLDGLIPASELSWGRFNHPREVVKAGQTIQGRIFRIERDNLRVALSIKQLSGDPWEQIENEIEIGKIATGKVISEAPFGIFIELMPGVEALLHNSEIPEGIEKPKVGSLITTKIIKIDCEQRKIGLSVRNIKQEDVSTSDTINESKSSELLVVESSVCNTSDNESTAKITNPEDLSKYNSTNGDHKSSEANEQSEIIN